jgi:hypothetical protein
LIRFTIAVSAGGVIGGITLSATSVIGVEDAGSTRTLTGSPKRFPGDRFQFWPSH